MQNGPIGVQLVKYLPMVWHPVLPVQLELINKHLDVHRVSTVDRVPLLLVVLTNARNVPLDQIRWDSLVLHAAPIVVLVPLIQVLIMIVNLVNWLLVMDGFDVQKMGGQQLQPNGDFVKIGSFFIFHPKFFE